MTEKKLPAKPKKPAGEREVSTEALRRFIKTKGSSYLRDDNVSSIGIGYKQVDGKETDQLALVFTVDTKSAPEGLDLLGTKPLPESIEVEGIKVPTDVIERSYEPGFLPLKEDQQPTWWTRQDPIQPGMSVSSTKLGSGTIGCIVYDRADGTPYILSNWHVLCGPDGVVGDPIIQPGLSDDNRLKRNYIGTLVRSNLGEDGDCAIATIEGRKITETIAELDVIPESIGDPELGDTVIKCGRTTRVTYGRVKRISILSGLNYGRLGQKEISSFEIGTHPKHMPVDGEVSSGGDSGSVWMFADDKGKATSVLAGLHFAGETGGGIADEHALACYAKSVLNCLNVSLSVSVSPESAAVSTGYLPTFLSKAVPLPKTASGKPKDVAEAKDGATVLHYTHFSLAMSKSRKFAQWVAWNVDGASIKRLSRVNISFVKDDRLASDAQIGDELYNGNRLDRGHIARRADLLWGSMAEAKRANIDSFFFTNITPQIDDFNQSAKEGLWGRLENAVFDDVDVDDLRVSILGGPIFHDDDRVYRKIKIPREFWKIVLFVEKGALKARGFILTQQLDKLEVLDLDEFRTYQRPISEIEERTGLAFGAAVHNADLAEAPEALVEPLNDLSDIRWS